MKQLKKQIRTPDGLVHKSVRVGHSDFTVGCFFIPKTFPVRRQDLVAEPINCIECLAALKCVAAL